MRRATSSKVCHMYMSAAKLKPIAGNEQRADSLTSSWYFTWQIMFLGAPLPARGIARKNSRCTPVRVFSCHLTSCLGPKGQGKPGAQERPAKTICCSSVLKYAQSCVIQDGATTALLLLPPCGVLQAPALWICLWRQAGRQSWAQATITSWGSWEQGWYMQNAPSLRS